MFNVIIFGTGQGAVKITKFFEENELIRNINIIVYVDNYKKIDYFMEKNVVYASDIDKYNYDYIIIGSIWFEEITSQLLKIGVEKNKILPFFDTQYWTTTENKLSDLILRNKHKFFDILPGHFYSTIPCISEVKDKEYEIFESCPKNIEGIDLNDEYQLSLFNKLKVYYKDIPFSENKNEKVRYYFGNNRFEYSDAIILYSIIRNFKPKKVIEIGSGYSSCVTLDTNKLFLNSKMECTFIEPYPELLNSLVGNEDLCKMEIVSKKLQDVNLETFDKLEKGDILFVDSTHVSKINSDVNYIIFKILPRLKDGVIIHFHDIFYPFEYPKQWIYGGTYWNEAYILRAFLQYNHKFEIMFFNSYFNSFYKELVEKHMPLCLQNTGGSIWIRKK